MNNRLVSRTNAIMKLLTNNESLYNIRYYGIMVDIRNSLESKICGNIYTKFYPNTDLIRKHIRKKHNKLKNINNLLLDLKSECICQLVF